MGKGINPRYPRYYKRYHLTNGTVNIIIDENEFYDQPIDSDIKRYEKIGKPTTGQDYTKITGYLVDYDYIKNLIG